MQYTRLALRSSFNRRLERQSAQTSQCTLYQGMSKRSASCFIAHELSFERVVRYSHAACGTLFARETHVAITSHAQLSVVGQHSWEHTADTQCTMKYATRPGAERSHHGPGEVERKGRAR